MLLSIPKLHDTLNDCLPENANLNHQGTTVVRTEDFPASPSCQPEKPKPLLPSLPLPPFVHDSRASAFHFCLTSLASWNSLLFLNAIPAMAVVSPLPGTTVGSCCAGQSCPQAASRWVSGVHREKPGRFQVTGTSALTFSLLPRLPSPSTKQGPSDGSWEPSFLRAGRTFVLNARAAAQKTLPRDSPVLM